MTGVIRSSPHKSSQTCPSKDTNGLNGELSPEKEPKVVRGKKRLDTNLLATGMMPEPEDEVDDASLLAAGMVPEPEDEVDDASLLAAGMMPEPEDEVDDASLLAVEMLPGPGKKQEEVGDYLEGMTAEMFGDDDEFDQCGRDINSEEEEVEALPDAHFGLLGSHKELLKPQGCIDDLPEEVLRQVLWQVPAQDLYRNVSLVCHRWRNIVQDPKVKQTTELHYVTY